MTYPQHIYYSIRSYLFRLRGVTRLFCKALLNQAWAMPTWDKLDEEDGVILWAVRVLVLTKEKKT
jgi:hypothetical protein